MYGLHILVKGIINALNVIWKLVCFENFFIGANPHNINEILYLMWKAEDHGASIVGQELYNNYGSGKISWCGFLVSIANKNQ